MNKNKNAIIIAALFLMLSMVASVTLSPNALGQSWVGVQVQSYAHLNVAPNPVGVGQLVTLNMFLLVPLLTSENAVNFTIVETTPGGQSLTLGPFNSDATGGTFTTMTPTQVGNYTFQFFYGGQTLNMGSLSSPVTYPQFVGAIELPSHSDVVTLVVQQTPISQSSAYPWTPLPTSYWQTPVTAENVQNWYKITGPWLGYGSVSFASTGDYNATGNYNPYTADVMSGHVLWTKVWAEGGVAGGDLGGTESSNIWSTSQYNPKYAPVVINGIMYSTWYTATGPGNGNGPGYSNGIMATDLYNGQTMWVINTTNPLKCGMLTQWSTINQYGVIGPYIWTTGTLPPSDTGGTLIPNSGTQWNMYDGLTGKYVLSIVNGTAGSLTTDANGNILSYYINSTVGTMTLYGNAPPTSSSFTGGGPQPITGKVNITSTTRYLVCWNMSQVFSYSQGGTGFGGSWDWSPVQNTVIPWDRGAMWAAPVPNSINGVPLGANLGSGAITGNAIMVTANPIGGSGTTPGGYIYVGAMDATTGAVLWLKNITSTTDPELVPYTRINSMAIDGYYVITNIGVTWLTEAYNVRTGAVAWTTTLKGLNGAAPNYYDQFGIKSWNGPDATMIFLGLGGDIWCINATNGNQVWYTNTTTLHGPSGVETPYGVWPLWEFNCNCFSNNVAYIAEGHEYNPPLFHGAQLLAINMTNGNLIWSELDFSVTSTEISYGIMLSLNAYDNQIYAFGQGPSATTVTAPNIGVTTATPITITGTVMDVSAGTQQQAVKSNFPNGVPCVSDASESTWMEYVYQQQLLPSNATGVPITISVLDSNNNYRIIGTTTSNTLGTFGFTWTPDIPRNYTVYASFAGSNSYYPSSAATQIYASLPATPAPTVTAQANLATTTDLMYYIVGAAVAIIIVIAIGFAFVLRKRP